jgi:hypothetical protein
MTSPESSKKAETAERKNELPSGDNVSDWFQDLSKRWKFAANEAEKGKNWKEKVLFFLSSFFVKIDKLSEEEKQIEEAAARKSGELLLQLPEEQIVNAIKKEMVGSKKLEDPQDIKVVDDFSTLLFNSAKNIGGTEDVKKKNFGIISKAADKFSESSTESLTPLEKRVLMAHSLSALTALKTHPDYNSVEKLATALDRFESATDVGKGLKYVKSSPRVRSLVKFTKEDAFSFKDLLPYIDVSFDFDVDVPLFGSLKLPVRDGAVGKDELVRKMTLAPLDDTQALVLQKAFAKILPNTSPQNRAKALQIINSLIVDKKPSLLNRRIAELVFLLDNRDFEFITKLLLV